MKKHPSWTYDAVANMTPYQQEHSLKNWDEESSVLEFNNEEEYAKWVTGHQSR